MQYQRIASISVGYKTDYQMYSMDFEEFLWAKGYSEEAISDMLCHMLEGVAFSEAEQMIFSNLFLEYCILGACLRLYQVILKEKLLRVRWICSINYW